MTRTNPPPLSRRDAMKRAATAAVTTRLAGLAAPTLAKGPTIGSSKCSPPKARNASAAATTSLVTAVGGTSGPPASHMVVVTRTRSIHGPWDDCPHNPMIHTKSADEPWGSRGHSTIFEGPAGDWWTIDHAYENGFRTPGRQTLLKSVEWTTDGWSSPRAARSTGRCPSRPKAGLARPALHCRTTSRRTSSAFSGASSTPTFYDRRDDPPWVKQPWQMKVSGYHHNVLGGFLSMKIGVYCAGSGEVRLSDFIYTASNGG